MIVIITIVAMMVITIMIMIITIIAYANLTPSFWVKRDCESQPFFLLTPTLRQPSESSAITKR